MINEEFWRQAPKTYCDDSNVAIVGGTIGDMFLLALLSGQQTQVFAFTPGHIKRFSQLLSHNVKSYEDRNGVIKVDDWTPDMKAPFQVKDLKSK